MGTSTLVPVEEYLAAVYRPDREYVDGVVLERNVGEKDHSRLQILLGALLVSLEHQFAIHGYTGQRVQVAPTRFRVPDLCAVVGPEPEEQIFTKPPFLCIEILSPEDRMERMQERIDDYLNFGVRYVWLINPRTRQAWVYTSEGMRPVKDGVFRTQEPELSIPLAALFK